MFQRGGNDPTDPAKPGWGGRYRREADGRWRDWTPLADTDARAAVSRWRLEFQVDFANRMAWCVAVP